MSSDTTLIAAGSPLLSDVERCAGELLTACVAVATKLHQPGETAELHRVQGLSHALQSSMRQAIVDGFSHGDAYRGLVIAIGWFVRVQTLTADRDQLVAQLARSGLLAARMGDEAQGFGFPTMGDA